MNPTHYNTPTPGLTIASTSATTRATPISQANVTAPTQATTIMSASATGTGGRSGGGGGGGGGGAPAAAPQLHQMETWEAYPQQSLMEHML